MYNYKKREPHQIKRFGVGELVRFLSAVVFTAVCSFTIGAVLTAGLLTLSTYL